MIYEEIVMNIILNPLYRNDPVFDGCASVFADYAEKAFGIPWKKGEGGVSMVADGSLSNEEYAIVSDEKGTVLSASTEKGMHNALADLLSCIVKEGGTLSVPLITARHAPDCPYRGLMIDLARQWHPIGYLLEYVDLCWKNRASHIQLHFTDSQSFTLPICSYPELSTEGRTYTKEEIGLLVRYAKERGITLVPEVDIPGHTAQFFIKNPELFGNTGVLPACDEVFGALRSIFREVADMFPYSPYIHIGGDEADIGAWEKCGRTKEYMSRHGIADIHEMYAEYIRIVTEIIFDLGRTPIVWEGFSKEFNDRIDKRTIVIAWESYYQPAYDLAKAGFTLINCSWKPLYIVTPDTCWSTDEIAALDPWRWEHWWNKSVAYPEGYSIDRSYPVLGEQLCAWGDKISGWENWEEGIKLEMALVAERLPAMCGKLWDLDPRGK